MTQTKPLPRVSAHPGGRYLMTEDGNPFFWLGDTAWELFHRLTREDAAEYLANRAAKQYNVIQAVALAEVDGLNAADRYGEHPLVDGDPLRPNEAYFSRVDETIRMAESFGLYIALLPTWGDKVARLWGAGPIVFNPENAYGYGLWLGKRYREQTNVLWVLGGDRPAIYQGSDGEAHDDRLTWREMARGIREGLGSVPALFTYHPWGGTSSGAMIHDEAWLNMNMMQSGHGGGHDVPVWEMIARDYALRPTKATLDGEPNYEDHPVNPWPTWDPANGYYRDHDVRKQCYRSVFAGGCGVTYGHHSIWQFYETWREPINYPDRDWRAAMDRPGAFQVQHLRRLMESRPYFSRIPDQGLLASPEGEGGHHVQATRGAEGEYAIVYLPETEPVRVKLGVLRGPKVAAKWYNPRDGSWSGAGEHEARGEGEFVPPASGPDWVLVLDSVS